MLRHLILALAATCLFAAPAIAQNTVKPPHYPFSFDSPLGGYDMPAVQRGFTVYRQICSNCHSMNALSYRNLGEEGGPFAAYRVRDEATGEEKMQLGLHAGQRGTLLDIKDNLYVRAIASGVQIADIDHDTGQPNERPGTPSDHFRPPFPNETAARAANGGALPPDLSVITSAREGGADYVRCILTGYTGETVGTQYRNRCFPGTLISMSPPLSAPDLVQYDDGANASVDQMATDVVTFLQWADDPHMVARKRLGLEVLAYLLILSGLLYFSYKAVWRGEKH